LATSRTAPPSHAEAFYLPGAPEAAGGQRWCAYHPPAGASPRSLIVHAHAFAEEMNKSRRMVALQARALRDAGHAVLLMDLLGCGDSSGDFAEATWDAWIDDLLAAAAWLRSRAPTVPLWWWGTRGGALLAAAAARRAATPCGLLLCSPVASGALMLQQFLRTKSAAERLGAAPGDGARGPSPRDKLAAGQSVEVGGYVLTPSLATGLDQERLTPVPLACRQLVWLEVSGRPEPALSPAATPVLEAFRAAGTEVRAEVVPGPSFWQTTEIEVAPGLLQAAVAQLDRKPAWT
jgi:exosortase A-associated hydrolase 2